MFRKWFLRISIVGLTIVLVTIFHPVSNSLAQSKEPVVLKSWLVNFADCIEIWRQLSEDLKKIGIQVELKTGTISEYVGEIIKKPKDHPYHLVTMVWGAGPARLEPSFFLTELFHSERAKPGGRNYCSYENQEYDRVVDAQLKETDRNKRQKLVWEAQEIIHNTNAFFPIFHRDYIQAYNVKRIKNVVPVMGTGVGFPYIPWTFLKAEPVGKIREPRIVGKNDLITLNPFAVSQVQNESWLRLCYETFVMRDKETNLIPWAAESWNTVDDTTVDIVLRKGMAFHDGKPVTVDDVKFTFDYILKWKFPALSQVWRNIDSVEVLQNKNVRFKLKHPYAPFVANILLKAFVAPKHIWEKIPESVNVKNPQEWNNPNRSSCL